MSCSRTQYGDACGDRTQDLSIQSPTLYHYATALPTHDNKYLCCLYLYIRGTVGKFPDWVISKDMHMTSNHYDLFVITNPVHFLYFSDKLRNVHARIVLKYQLTYGIYEDTEHFEKPLNQIF